MRPVYLISDNIISSLGFTTDENAGNLLKGFTGIKLHDDRNLSPAPFWASVTDHNRLDIEFSSLGNPTEYTLFEKLIIRSVTSALDQTELDVRSKKTLVIISTTKGNIDILDRKNPFHHEPQRAYLWDTAQRIGQFFQTSDVPMVVSNACISGVLALITGTRLIRLQKYDHVIVTGADLVTEFVLAGFNSFLSLCVGPCKPFDKDRSGLSLGEAAGTIILSSAPVNSDKAPVIRNGFSTNDANHISGPSRTGEGLYLAIKKTLDSGNKIDYISAHGTATPYNDEMEAIALNRTGLNEIPVNSLKGYWGHTLGAAGIIETVATLYSLRNNILFKTIGYSVPGTSQPLAIIEQNCKVPVNKILKIASGFGGCNAALLIEK